MPTTLIDGIATHYQIVGNGSPILMFSPGGFDGALDNWSTMGLYERIELVDRLSASHACILFDKRESGRSGARVQRLGWADYVAQGAGLLDHLGIERAHLLGGCVGCSVAGALAGHRPDRVLGLVLVSPAGGAQYRMKQNARFAKHLAFVDQHGLAAVVEHARNGGQAFSVDPRVGPWGSAIRHDDDFAAAYAALDVTAYATLLAGIARTMFDRDTVPGVEPEDLMQLSIPALIVPGNDSSHATSAARFLQECLPAAQYWDVPVEAQTAGNAPARILEFLAEVEADR